MKSSGENRWEKDLSSTLATAKQSYQLSCIG